MLHMKHKFSLAEAPPSDLEVFGALLLVLQDLAAFKRGLCFQPELEKHRLTVRLYGE